MYETPFFLDFFFLCVIVNKNLNVNYVSFNFFFFLYNLQK